MDASKIPNSLEKPDVFASEATKRGAVWTKAMCDWVIATAHSNNDKALVGLAWAAINVNSLPMVVEMCKGSDIGKFTGYYYTASMAAQVITPILAGTLMRAIDYRILFPYAALFAALSFLTMCFVRHGDVKAQPRQGLDAFEDMEE